MHNQSRGRKRNEYIMEKISAMKADHAALLSLIERFKQQCDLPELRIR